jgi:HAD superfamily hydrolase (TIGR01509 family)
MRLPPATARESEESGVRTYQAVIFDMDGTLIEPTLDFLWVRKELGIRPEEDILSTIAKMPSDKADRAATWLHQQELAGVGRARLMPGARRTLRLCRQAGLGIALLTRNSAQSMQIAVERIGPELFDVTLSRESGPIKPEPDGILRCCHEIGAQPQRVAAVGDFKYDVEAANAAGAVSVLLAPGDKPAFASRADHVIDRLDQLPDLLGI